MKETRKKGFAAWTPEKHREVAAQVPPEERSFSRDKDLAREAARKGGGVIQDPANRSFSKDRDLAAKAGKAGGLAVPKEHRGFFKNRELAREANKKAHAARRANAALRAEKAKAGNT